MGKNIIDTIKGAFQETDEEKALREEKELATSNQKTIIESLICPVCSGGSFEKGRVSNSGPYGGNVSEIMTYHGNHYRNYEVSIRVCSACGHVLFFADFGTRTQEQKKF